MGRNILILDPVDPVCAKVLIENGFKVEELKLTSEELLTQIQNYEGIIVSSNPYTGTTLSAGLLKAASRLGIVGCAGSGSETVDSKSAAENNIRVVTAADFNAVCPAEFTCFLITSLARNIPAACLALKNGVWDRKSHMGNELFGSTLAILGFGRIGKEVAIRMKSFGMRLIGSDPFVSADIMSEFGVEKMPLEETLPIADYITLHMSLIPETRGSINDDFFSKCKRGVRLINTARGELLSVESLLRNLNSGQCDGVALDVYAEIPPTSMIYKELFAHPRTICTPFIGCVAVEAKERVGRKIAEQFIQFFKSKTGTGAAEY